MPLPVGFLRPPLARVWQDGPGLPFPPCGPEGQPRSAWQSQLGQVADSSRAPSFGVWPPQLPTTPALVGKGWKQTRSSWCPPGKSLTPDPWSLGTLAVTRQSPAPRTWGEGRQSWETRAGATGRPIARRLEKAKKTRRLMTAEVPGSTGPSGAWRCRAREHLLCEHAARSIPRGQDAERGGRGTRAAPWTWGRPAGGEDPRIPVARDRAGGAGARGRGAGTGTLDHTRCPGPPPMGPVTPGPCHLLHASWWLVLSTPVATT